MSQKRSYSTANPSPDASGSVCYTSNAIHDRQSKFIALFSPSPSHLRDPSSLQSHPSLDGAMHRILAWRKQSSQKSLTSIPRYETGSDEDGEKWAGKRVERVLGECGVEGVAVVGRWYGGVMLGPVRFTHIEDVVREAVGLWRKEEARKKVRIEGEQQGKERVEDDQGTRDRLCKVLGERDGSVAVLRELLAEKQRLLEQKRSKGKEVTLADIDSKVDSETTAAGDTVKTKKDLDGSQPVSQSQSPAKPLPDYKNMTVARLRALEKARDATLTWILKQITSVEQQLDTMEPKASIPD